MARPQTPRYDSGRPAPGAKACGAKAAAGGTVWDSIVYDPRLDLLFVGAGNGARGATYCVRVDAGTTCSCPPSWRSAPTQGAYVWHYQLVPGRQLGLHGHPTPHPRRPEGWRTPSSRCYAGAEERLLLRVGGGHWKAAVSGEIRAGHLGQRNRPEDRPADRKPGVRYTERKAAIISPSPIGAHNCIPWRSVRGPAWSTCPSPRPRRASSVSTLRRSS